MNRPCWKPFRKNWKTAIKRPSPRITISWFQKWRKKFFLYFTGPTSHSVFFIFPVTSVTCNLCICLYQSSCSVCVYLSLCSCMSVSVLNCCRCMSLSTSPAQCTVTDTYRVLSCLSLPYLRIWLSVCVWFAPTHSSNHSDQRIWDIASPNCHILEIHSLSSDTWSSPSPLPLLSPPTYAHTHRTHTVYCFLFLSHLKFDSILATMKEAHERRHSFDLAAKSKKYTAKPR